MRSIQKFLVWLAAAHQLTYPSSHLQLIEYMQIGHSEPCPRGSLKLTHVAFVFLEELSCVQEKYTEVSLYLSAKKELMATDPESKQAQRCPLVVLAA